jgi:hypothetical protein
MYNVLHFTTSFEHLKYCSRIVPLCTAVRNQEQLEQCHNEERLSRGWLVQEKF